MAEKTETQEAKASSSFLYEVTRALASALFHTLMPVKFIGREKLDREAPYVLIANHRHALDPVAMAMGVRGRQVVFERRGQAPVTALLPWSNKSGVWQHEL